MCMHVCTCVYMHVRVCVQQGYAHRESSYKRPLPATSTYRVPARAKAVCEFSHCSHPPSTAANFPFHKMRKLKFKEAESC